MSRIYKSQTGVNYEGKARSQGFAPVRASDDVKAAQEYGQARIQDAQMMGQAIIRNLTLQQNAEEMQMQADRAGLQNQQVGERGALANEQLLSSQMLKSSQTMEMFGLQYQQTVDKNSLALGQLNERMSLSSNQLLDKQGLETTQMDASHKLQNFQNQFRADMANDAARWRADVASAQADFQKTSIMINGLISFAKIGVSAASEIAKAKEIRKREEQQQMQIDALLGGIGLGTEDLGNPSGLTTQEVETSSAIDTIASSETTAITNATEDLVQSNNPIEQATGLQARQETLAMQLAPIRGNVYSARSMFPVAFQEAVSSGRIRPGVQGLADAQAFTREFVQAAGLMGADKKLLAEVFAPTAMQVMQNAVVSATREHNEATLKANQISVQSRISDVTDGANTATIGQAFEIARSEAVQGNIGLTDPKLATTYTLGEMLTNLTAEGKKAEITSLRNHVYNPSTGRTLGQDFDHLFDQAEYKAEGRAIEGYNRAQRQVAITQQNLVDSFFSAETPEQKQDIINQLRGMGTEAGFKAATELQTIGTRYDPQAALQLSREYQESGVLPSKGTIETLFRDGRINQKEYNFWKDRTVEGIADGVLKPIAGTLNADIRNQIVQNSGGKADSFSGQLAGRVQAAKDAVLESLSLEVANNPDLAKDLPALRQRAIEMTANVLSRPEFRATYDPNTNSITFKNPLSKGNAIPRVAPGKEDYTSLRADQIFSPAAGIPRAAIQPSQDIIVPKSQLQADAKALLNGDTAGISNRTRLIAKNLRISPRALIDGQMRAHFGKGLSTLESLQRAQQTQPQQNTDQSANPVSPSMTGRQRTVAMGRQLLRDGFTIWQHPNFDIDRGYVPEGGARVAQRSYNSAHHHEEALDFPLSHNSEAKLDWLYNHFKRNKERFGINELLWKSAGHHDHLHVSFHQ